jgi:hypothetical protein
MSIALYMDENVHRAVTNGLRLRGIDVLTVQGVLLRVKVQKMPRRDCLEVNQGNEVGRFVGLVRDESNGSIHRSESVFLREFRSVRR